jgi:hypothetical protein
MDKVEKLVYIYVNSALLDSMDKTDYFEDPDSDSDLSAGVNAKMLYNTSFHIFHIGYRQLPVTLPT